MIFMMYYTCKNVFDQTRGSDKQKWQALVQVCRWRNIHNCLFYSTIYQALREMYFSVPWTF